MNIESAIAADDPCNQFVDILFIGDAFLSNLSTVGSLVWNRQIRPWRAVNRASESETIETLARRLPSLLADFEDLRLIVLQIGHNDGQTNLAEKLIGAIQAVKKNWPFAKLLILGISAELSVSDLSDDNSIAINSAVSEFCGDSGIGFFDPAMACSFKGVGRQIIDNAEWRALYFRLAPFLISAIRDQVSGIGGLRGIPGTHADEALSTPLIHNETYFFRFAKSKVLWVVFSPRAVGRGRFTFFRGVEQFATAALFFLTPREDFYQNMIENCLNIIDSIRKEHGYERIYYLGFSAGAFASLVVGMRSLGTARIIAFQPQFRLDDPITIADFTLVPPSDALSRFDPRYCDILDELAITDRRIDIFLGVQAEGDGIAVAQASRLKNPNVTSHFTLTKHDVSGELDARRMFIPVLRAAATDADIALPASIRASADDVTVAALVYDYILLLRDPDCKPALPQLPLDDVRNPAWWSVISRVHARHKNMIEATTYMFKAVAIEHESDQYLVSSAHYLRDFGLHNSALGLYTDAAQRNPISWTPWAGQIEVHIQKGDKMSAEAALAEAVARSLPQDIYDRLMDAIARLPERPPTDRA